MIKISEDEAKYLITQRVNFGNNGLAKTHCSYKHYFLTETTENMRLLKQYRESKSNK